jgi:hypothetical protein
VRGIGDFAAGLTRNWEVADIDELLVKTIKQV